MNLKVDTLSAGYGKTPVLRQISLCVGPGKICALMGRNGSGKTTLLRCINGVLPPRAGQVLLMGQDITLLNRKRISRHISLVPQVYVSPFSFLCMDMVLMACAPRIHPWAAPGKIDRKKALKVMAETGIDHMAQRPFNLLSGGERQLVMLARGLFQDTPILLLDEPTAHLDFTNQHRIMALVRKLAKKRQMTVLITLHDPNLALYYCDEVILIHAGQVAAFGPTKPTLTDSVLSTVLGDNIQRDITHKGLSVVTPKQIISKKNTEVTP
ncbi:MAG: ABC transporter ATP-binding protein [Proteobacteria bacterium]|nr:ABC transporter ATP-binding protein [Desulfobacula sp.]MBU3951432.1 ABC transporter ATP-binding protein [Pseudomonadota bacterium]MBU4131306.1 ABC transporter ATP-binding protein [Pseudomonadota bacterium]